MLIVSDIRRLLAEREPDSNGMREIIAAQFIADESSIFGDVNTDWHDRELAWYLSESLNVNDIYGDIPKIWQDVSDRDGYINSNYGWCIFSRENGRQYDNAIEALMQDPYSRQANMIYTRPSMHVDAKKNGRRDFMCTNTVQLLIRNDVLYYIVNMRSSDAVFGYKGDRYWHEFVFNRAILDIGNVSKGHMVWNAGSLHVYPRHESLVQEWINGPE